MEQKTGQIVKGTCDANTSFEEVFVKPAGPVVITADQLPKEKIDAMIAYGAMLRKKFPHMNPNRIKRKIAEHFKVKLV